MRENRVRMKARDAWCLKEQDGEEAAFSRLPPSARSAAARVPQQKARTAHSMRELEMPGIEPGASRMRSERSTTELHPRPRRAPTSTPLALFSSTSPLPLFTPSPRLRRREEKQCQPLHHYHHQSPTSASTYFGASGEVNCFAHCWPLLLPLTTKLLTAVPTMPMAHANAGSYDVIAAHRPARPVDDAGTTKRVITTSMRKRGACSQAVATTNTIVSPLLHTSHRAAIGRSEMWLSDK
ncbi:hypothetical protein ECG_08237 [Echinococcus granulosus]|nr:hypothetical protein ECG_08237 [Echinococcus granulosus]